jgi:AraC-like DNA-binding protein
MTRRAETPMAFVRAIVLAYERYGLSPDAALRKAGISQAQLRREDARVESGQFEEVSAAAMQELNDEALGWFSRRLPWGTYGLLCRASLTAPTLGVALKLWCRHHRLLTEDLLLSLEVDRGVAHLRLEERRDFGPLRELCLLTNLRYVHGYACWLVDSQLPLREVTFPFAAPRHQAVYPLLFPGPPRFEARQASFSFDSRHLDLPSRRDEQALRVMLKRALPLTVRQYRKNRLLAERVRRVLLDPRDPRSTADAIAAALHLSVRTLHRQLALEGASLQGLKDEVRSRLALDALGRTDLSIKEVARAAGFTSEKSFSRAFKQWTGHSPGAHRRRLASG